MRAVDLHSLRLSVGEAIGAIGSLASCRGSCGKCYLCDLAERLRRGRIALLDAQIETEIEAAKESP